MSIQAAEAPPAKAHFQKFVDLNDVSWHYKNGKIHAPDQESQAENYWGEGQKPEAGRAFAKRAKLIIHCFAEAKASQFLWHVVWIYVS